MKVSEWKQSRRRGKRKPKVEPVWPPPEYDLPSLEELHALGNRLMADPDQVNNRLTRAAVDDQAESAEGCTSQTATCTADDAMNEDQIHSALNDRGDPIISDLERKHRRNAGRRYGRLKRAKAAGKPLPPQPPEKPIEVTP